MFYFQVHTDYVTSVAFSPDGNNLVKGHTKFVTIFAFSPDSNTLASGS